MLGPRVPIVISLDLHGILTSRMLEHRNRIAVYWTYPHQDFVDTGSGRAVLLRILDGGVRPVMARLKVPALVRGRELITATGCYGGFIRAAQRLEREEGALAAAMMIGNPFTDVPELCSQPLVITDDDEDAARDAALALARDFWAERARMQASLVSLEEAIRGRQRTQGDGDLHRCSGCHQQRGIGRQQRATLKGLLEHGYAGRAVMPVVDRPAAERAHAAGVGAHLTVAIGGTLDPQRFPPLEVEAEVVRLGDGRWRHQVSGLPADAGHTAVLQVGPVTLIVVSNAVHMMDRAIFVANGCDPESFDLVVVKSPGAYARFFTFAERNYVLDIPGATTANLKLLGHTVCARPMYPLDDDVTFEPAAEVYRG